MLWNIDLTLVDVTRVTREAYADAFRTVTGRPLVQLPQMAGRSESEIFFDALALNGVDVSAVGPSEQLLAPFGSELATALAARRDLLHRNGHAMPGAREALTAVGKLDGVVQTVLTGTSKPNALLKLRSFGLESFFDFTVGGYGSEPYPKGAWSGWPGSARRRSTTSPWGSTPASTSPTRSGTWQRPGWAVPSRRRSPAGARPLRSYARPAPTSCSPTSPTRTKWPPKSIA